MSWNFADLEQMIFTTSSSDMNVSPSSSTEYIPSSRSNLSTPQSTPSSVVTPLITSTASGSNQFCCPHCGNQFLVTTTATIVPIPTPGPILVSPRAQTGANVPSLSPLNTDHVKISPRELYANTGLDSAASLRYDLPPEDQERRKRKSQSISVGRPSQVPSLPLLSPLPQISRDVTQDVSPRTNTIHHQPLPPPSLSHLTLGQSSIKNQELGQESVQNLSPRRTSGHQNTSSRSGALNRSNETPFHDGPSRVGSVKASTRLMPQMEISEGSPEVPAREPAPEWTSENHQFFLASYKNLLSVGQKPTASLILEEIIRIGGPTIPRHAVTLYLRKFERRVRSHQKKKGEIVEMGAEEVSEDL
ncbi:soluble scavenger receptor cysteine-rich domain-containing protein SSC5D [Planoprotostelium fungivorum]|uniref:Soluble scavenger receptor cysteine-rich domain-containing protein SSC5D n=1 Tax=Planoprotostelium fungivorum TaxID=1890364 RepID=A0A2P6NWL2_9EUKA|nr:soluble scavenger receptor cysteine-rich domain-containing protein SSC5D [Planoprotostelium fungivorum]